MCTGLEIALVATAVGGTAASVASSNKASREQRKAAEAQANREQLEAARARSQELRKAQIERQRVVAAAAAQGGGISGNSAVQGGIGSIQTQSVENRAFSSQISMINQGISDRLSSASLYQQQAGNYQALANTATTAYSLYNPSPTPQQAPPPMMR